MNPDQKASIIMHIIHIVILIPALIVLAAILLTMALHKIGIIENPQPHVVAPCAETRK